MRKFIQKAKSGDTDRRKGSGRPRLSGREDDDDLVDLSLDDPFKTLKFELTKSKPTTIAGVREVMQQILNGLTAKYLCSLFASMPRWVQRVIKAAWGATKY